jgi:hypothetical protein
MSNYLLGNVPALSRLSLIDGQDFVHEFTLYSTMPPGTDVFIELLNPPRTYTYGIWPAVGNTVRIDAADHDQVINGSWFRVWAVYPDDGGRFCWLAGPVGRNRR